MKTRNIILIGVIIVVLVSIFYSFQGGNNEAYKEKIENARKEKDHQMRTGSDSPFKKKADSFKGLKYFPVDDQFRISARLTPLETKMMLILPTSDGKEKTYLEYGYAEFELNGIQNKLLILEMLESGPYRGTLFLPFADETSANETYGAGRYLDVKKVRGSTSITLDFNEAYNPYCAYSDDFSCPFPPKENTLKVAIRAGEMTYDK